MRLAVQFQSITDTFSAHDSVFSFTTASELTESNLGLSAMSQSPGSNTPSLSSLRQQRLDGIAEDNEESPASEETAAPQLIAGPIENEQDANKDSLDTLPASAARAKAMLAKRREESKSEVAPDVQQIQVARARAEERAIEPLPELETARFTEPTSTIQIPEPVITPTPTTHPPRSSSITDKALPAPPLDETTPPVSPPSTTQAQIRPSIDFSLPAIDSESDDDVRRPIPKEYVPVRQSQHLSAAESSSISKWTDEVVASTRSKQKRGPRPSAEGVSRPKTSGTNDDQTVSRRANLPTSVRVSNRSSGQPSRPGSQQSSRSVPARFVPSSDLPPPLPSPTIPVAPIQRPSAYRASSHASSLAPENTVPPEKLRLMKALQMRKRNQLLAQRSASAASIPTTLASIDSTTSEQSDPSTVQTSLPNRESASHGPELASIDESQTTSPTSISTESERNSTKPSSVSERGAEHKSHTSISSDTNSSTTPKADEKLLLERTNTERLLCANEARSEQSKAEVPKFVTSDQPKESVKVPEEQLATPSEKSNADRLETASASQQAIELEQTRHETSETHSPAALRRKKRLFDGRITIPNQSVDGSDASDDDSFIEELQNATVQEATSMSVNRTPITPVLARIPTRDFRDLSPVTIATTKTRTISNGSQISTPGQRRAGSRAGSTRSLSTALPQWPPQPTEPVPALPKQRPQISAGISRRVKTFEGLAQRESAGSSASAAKDPTPRASAFSSMLKRASFLGSSHSVDKTSERSPMKAIPSPLRSEFGDLDENSKMRPMVQRSGTNTEVYSPTHKGESVTVTARIVRDPTKPQTANGTSDTRNMHWSPLIVEHGTTEVNDLQRPPLLQGPSVQSIDSLASTTSHRRRFSLSSYRTNTRNLSPTETRSHRMSFTPGKKNKAPSETSSMADDKQGSRTSRMLKRLSGLGKRNRDTTLTSPTRETLSPDTIAEHSESPDPTIRNVVDIGEVNVQFPDTLLWKRRFLRVDDQGHLIFAPPTNDFSTRGKSHKLHLDELYKPALPDLEREQMAWSIVLDLKEGGTVQCACESKEAQMSFLKSE